MDAYPYINQSLLIGFMTLQNFEKTFLKNRPLFIHPLYIHYDSCPPTSFLFAVFAVFRVHFWQLLARLFPLDFPRC